MGYRVRGSEYGFRDDMVEGTEVMEMNGRVRVWGIGFRYEIRVQGLLRAKGLGVGV